MARPRTPDGRRVPVSYKLTEDERDLADSLRGDTGRSVWLREMAMERMRQLRDSRIRESLGIGIIVDDRQPTGIVSVIAPGEEATQVRSFALTPEEPAPGQTRKRGGKGPCEHRVQPGSYCRTCKRLI